ncbi:60S ribosomal protein L34-B [Colletotrichum higginsianum]|nr:60S ribosomal protein L34-B [Colletotrichum higginsianum]
MAGNRVTYRRRNGYNTSSNLTRIVKTPGGELRVLHIKKRGTAPKCGDCGVKLPGFETSYRSRSDRFEEPFESMHGTL